MKSAVFQEPYHVEIQERPDPEIQEPGDAIIQITHTAICGSDLWFYRGKEEEGKGEPIGHEPMGIVEAVGDGSCLCSVCHQLWNV